MTVNPSTMRLGIAAILIGLVGAYGVRLVMEGDELPPPAKPKKFLVPIAGQDIPTGRVVRKGDISMLEMDLDEMKQKGMPLNLVMRAADQIIGRRTRKPIPMGEAFLTNALFLDGDGPANPPRPGYRAVAVTVPLSRGGYAQVDDVVDVYFTSTPRPADEKIRKRAIPEVTIQVADALTVLQASNSDQSSRAPATTYLLEARPDQVTKIQALLGHGEFSFHIRPENDISIAKGTGEATTLEDILGLEDEPEPMQQPYWPIEYYRGGSRTQQNFPIPVTPEQIAEMQRRYDEQNAQRGKSPNKQVSTKSDVEEQSRPAVEQRRSVPTLRGRTSPAPSPAVSQPNSAVSEISDDDLKSPYQSNPDDDDLKADPFADDDTSSDILP